MLLTKKYREGSTGYFLYSVLNASNKEVQRGKYWLLLFEEVLHNASNKEVHYQTGRPGCCFLRSTAQFSDQ